MISQDAFSNLDYKQGLATCVLASYAVAAYPFAKIPVLDFFVAYCCQFGLPHEHPERSYEDDFLQRHPGYDVIWKLHHDSTVPVFEACRKAFSLENVFPAQLATIEQRLVAGNSTLMLFMNTSARKQDLELADMHSIGVAYSPDCKFFYYDTGRGKLVRNISSLRELGDCGHRFLLIGKDT